MGVADNVETGRTKIYDDCGRTRIPDAVRENLGWGSGDKIKMVAIDGEMRVVRVEDDE
jgi:bifunctional DNA-binding transcriptional regulator/antitoxin component of YhaV-PrlF toxin-antitoxin module